MLIFLAFVNSGETKANTGNTRRNDTICVGTLVTEGVSSVSALSDFHLYKVFRILGFFHLFFETYNVFTAMNVTIDVFTIAYSHYSEAHCTLTNKHSWLAGCCVMRGTKHSRACCCEKIISFSVKKQ